MGGLSVGGSFNGVLPSGVNLVISGGVGSITTTLNGNLKLVPHGTGITQIGDAGSPSRFATPTNDDLFVSGRLEVDGTAYFDGSAVVSSGLSIGYLGTVGATYNTFCFLGAPNSTNAHGVIASYKDDGLHIATNSSDGKANNNVIITSMLNYAKDHDHDIASANPTLIIHSSTDPDVANDQFGLLDHDTTNFRVRTGKGAVEIIARNSAPTLNTASSIAFYLDETDHNLKVLAKYADGTTTKTATIPLV